MSKLAKLRSRFSLKNTVVHRVKERVRIRRGPMAPPFELEYRHIFVLPTIFGWGFGLMLLAMALGGLNFNNNMALMLVFLLGTITQLTTFIAYRNLNGLKIENVYAEPVFCEEIAHFLVFISNGNDRQRFAVQAGIDKPTDCADFILNKQEVMNLTCTTTKRGWLDLSSFRLETRFPLGLFKAWSWIFPHCRCLVYPKPARNAPPLPRIGEGHTGQAKKGDGEQVYGLRKYYPGDSKQRIAWRASARHDKLYSMEMEAPVEEACELDWNLLQENDAELRLSILTAWVIAADHKQLDYSLNLPGKYLPAGNGAPQLSACLEALALFDTGNSIHANTV
jgi:uncharacterized protein (DUF58 family)